MTSERYRVRCGILPIQKHKAEHWRLVLMPPIPQTLLDCSVYLYPTKEAAEAGERFGGSGFLFSVPVEGHEEGWVTLYVVTNRHVLDQGGRFIRVNKIDGGTHVIETQRYDWADHSQRYDVAAYSLDLEASVVQFASLFPDHLITREVIADWDLRPGDEAFLVGRLITPWGQQRNVPAVRFGNISMMADPSEPAIGYENVLREAFLVECRSLSGFSGSPVFCSTTRRYDWDGKMPTPLLGQPRYTKHRRYPLPAPEGTFGPWLLGIDWGHLPLWRPVYTTKSFDYPKAQALR